MKGPTVEEVRALQAETGDGMMACKKILEQKYAEEEKQEMIAAIQSIKQMFGAWNPASDRDIFEEIVPVLEYLVRKV